MPNRGLQPDPAGFHFDKVARFYDTLNSIVEVFCSRRRKEILSRARGDILEVGVGTGCSFKDYPPGQHIVAVDTSREMLIRAEEKRKNYSGRIELRKEDIQNLSFKDESFDTIFCSWVFCSVTDPVRGLNQLHRILKKDGQLLMLEHVRSKNRVLSYLMDRLNPLIARVGIDNMNRDTAQHVRRVGFKIEQERNLVYDVAKAIVASK
jgi:ubiquinone/menaquinone biosynthesis C-methylase UbiE